MRRHVPAMAVVAVGALLASCSSRAAGPTMRYYDPIGLFSARLPALNQLVIVPPQRIEGEAPLLSGVLALPAQPSAQPTGGAGAFGGGFLQPVTQQDTAIYAVYAVKTTRSMTVGQIGAKLLASTIGPRIVSQQSISAGGLHGVLAVVNHNDSSSGLSYTDASGFFIDGLVAYWIRELFPTGDWDRRKQAFIDLLHSFRPGVPAGLVGVPLTRANIQVEESGLGAWPLG
jgi:hypothetical protein